MLDYNSRQLEIEDFMATEATVRQDRDMETALRYKDWSGSKVGKRFVNSVIKASDIEGHAGFLTSVNEFIGSVSVKTVGRHNIAAKMLHTTGIEPSILAYLSVKSIFNILAIRPNRNSNRDGAKLKRSTLCMRVGDIIHDEWRIRFFADTKNRKALLKKLFKDFDKKGYDRIRRKKTLRNYFDSELVSWQGWSKSEKMVVGFAMLSLFATATGLLEYVSNGTHVVPTDKLVESVDSMSAKLTSSFFLYRPMIVKPQPWSDTNLFRGGYLSNKTRRYPLVKGSGKRDAERLGKRDWSRVIPAINALQETPHRVNKQMLDVVLWAYDVHEGERIGKLPQANIIPLLPVPYNYDDPVAKKLHDRLIFDIHDANRRNKSGRISTRMLLNMAQEFAEFPKIYFPHNLDSRGRAYPLSAFLSPQGADHTKAILEFANGQPILNDSDACWLAIAGANAYGEDKVSLQDRVFWTQDNEAMILSIANDYKIDFRWTRASEPFQFLRFCFEWAAFKSHGMGYMSHMVIPVDATCSGLQHYSAMFRDEVGGAGVNLVPHMDRQDIYSIVAQRVVDNMMADGLTVGLDWIAFGIDRKLTKRQVMVVPYAGKFSSCLSYTDLAVSEKLSAGLLPYWDTDDRKDHQSRVVYLAQHIWKAIGEIVIKAREGMVWLSSVARDFAKARNLEACADVYEHAMFWSTPDGFEVVHFREDTKLARVKTQLEGTFFLSYNKDLGKLNANDMALAIAPNFVHALDACHLRMTIMKGLQHDITEFVMIHDSFGVHAGEMWKFLDLCVKPAFVQMYETDVVQNIKDRYPNLGGELPSKGSLDLQGVLESEFFFS